MVGKGGPKLRASAPDAPDANAPGGGAHAGKGTVSVVAAASNAGTFIDLGKGASISIEYSNNRIEGKKVTMAGFDMTRIQGTYDFSLEFSPEDFRAMLNRFAVIAGATLPPEALKLPEAARATPWRLLWTWSG
jgi:uncharacterized protein (TIGR03435 family)